MIPGAILRNGKPALTPRDGRETARRLERLGAVGRYGFAPTWDDAWGDESPALSQWDAATMAYARGESLA